jgi:hypothetical protein
MDARKETAAERIARLMASRREEEPGTKLPKLPKAEVLSVLPVLAVGGEVAQSDALPDFVQNIIRVMGAERVRIIDVPAEPSGGEPDPPHAVPEPLGPPPVDPQDMAERIAILVADGAPDAEAEPQALAEAGWPSWEAYADVSAAWVGAKIEAAQAPSSGPLRRHWPTLRQATLDFLASPWWLLACRCGWGLTEIFGIHRVAPLVCWDCAGLITYAALSTLAPLRLTDLSEEGAALETRSGSLLRWPRHRSSDPAIAPWWEEDAGSGMSPRINRGQVGAIDERSPRRGRLS